MQMCEFFQWLLLLDNIKEFTKCDPPNLRERHFHLSVGRKGTAELLKRSLVMFWDKKICPQDTLQEDTDYTKVGALKECASFFKIW